MYTQNVRHTPCTAHKREREGEGALDKRMDTDQVLNEGHVRQTFTQQVNVVARGRGGGDVWACKNNRTKATSQHLTPHTHVHVCISD